MPRRLFPTGLAQVFSAYCSKKKINKNLPYYNTATYTVNYATMCPGTVMIHLRSSLYPLRHSRDKLFQTLYHFHSASKLGGAYERGQHFPVTTFFQPVHCLTAHIVEPTCTGYLPCTSHFLAWLHKTRHFLVPVYPVGQPLRSPTSPAQCLQHLYSYTYRQQEHRFMLAGWQLHILCQQSRQQFISSQ